MATPVRIKKQAPIAGLRSAWPSTALNDTEAPRCLNVRFRFGEVRNAPGRSLLAGPLAGESVLDIRRFNLSDGTTEWATALSPGGWFRWGATVPGTPRQWSRVPGSGLTGTTRYGVTLGEDYMFVARGTHSVYRWNGVAATAYEVIPALGTFAGGNAPRARYAEYFANHLVLGWTTEGGTDHANRVRWAKNGDHTYWTIDGTGAGFLDFYEGNAEPIMGIKGLGARCAVYQPHFISDLIPTGTLSPVFATETRVRGIGTRAPYTIASDGQRHFFLGLDCNVYAWDGTQLTPIGDRILRDLQGIVYPDQMGSYFGVVSTLRQEYWLVIGGTDVFVYDFVRDSWSRDSFASLTALGEVTDTFSNETWTTVSSTWDSELRTWADMGGTSRTALWYGRSDGATGAIDETINYDYFAIGSIIDRYCETPDWFVPDANGEERPSDEGTLQRVLLEYEYTGSSPFEFGVSVDRGRTWTTRSITPTVAGFSFVDVNVTGNTFRFRFRENDVNGSFRWRTYEYQFIPGGQYLAS